MKSAIEYQKVTVRLEKNQVDDLRKMFPDVPYNQVLRAVVKKYIELHKKRVQEKLEEIELEGEDGIGE